MPPKVTRQTATEAPANSVDVLQRIKPIGFGLSEGINIMLYGRSGTGKTTLWSTFPKPILALVCSGGVRPGEVRSIDDAENRKVIDSVPIFHSQEAHKVLENFHLLPRQYKTIVIDHGTGVQDMILKEVLGLAELPLQKSWGLATQEQYGICVAQSKEVFYRALSINCNTVIVAQQREFKGKGDPEMVIPHVGAGLMPTLADWLNQSVDYIGQTFIRQKEETIKTDIGGEIIETVQKTRGVDYCLRTGAHELYHTKFRKHKKIALPEMIEDPSYEKIIKIIRGGG